MKMPEALLMCGLGSISLASGLLPFPLFGLVGRGLLPVTLVILVAAFAVLPVKPGVPLWRRRAVFVLYLIGVALAIVIAGEASLMAHDVLVFSRQSDFEKVTTFEWILIGLSTLLPASLFFLAVHLRSTWSEKRCALWTMMLLLVCPVAIGIFRLLALFLPLAA